MAVGNIFTLFFEIIFVFIYLMCPMLRFRSCLVFSLTVILILYFSCVSLLLLLLYLVCLLNIPYMNIYSIIFLFFVTLSFSFVIFFILLFFCSIFIEFIYLFIYLIFCLFYYYFLFGPYLVFIMSRWHAQVP